MGECGVGVNVIFGWGGFGLILWIWKMPALASRPGPGSGSDGHGPGGRKSFVVHGERSEEEAVEAVRSALGAALLDSAVHDSCTP